MTAPLVELRAITKTFPGVLALKGVDLEVMPGEIHGLVGKNGAGKSTLVSVLTGLLRPDRGEVRINGRTLQSFDRRTTIEAGIGLVPQQVRLVPYLTVAENIFCGKLPTNRTGNVDWKQVYDRAQAILDSLNVPVAATTPAGELKVAEQKMVAIAQALSSDMKLIVLDEPTAALPRDDAEIMFSFIRKLKDRGVSFIYISHHLDEVFAVCDRVTVMCDGARIGTYPVSELDMPKLVQLISGANVENYTRRTEMADGPVVLEVKHLTREGAFYDINLTVRRGEVVGLAGLQGSGASEMMRAIYGLEPATGGEIRVDGQPVTIAHTLAALNSGIAWVPDDRRRFGIVGLRPIRENIALSVLHRLTVSLGFYSPRRERALAEQYVNDLNIVTPSLDQPVEFLSGGNQQKVLFARVAAVKPRVLLLDQPAQGVDVQAKAEIFRIVDMMSREGIAVVLYSSEINELLDNCDRILVFREGRIRAEIAAGTPEATEPQILLLAEGG